VDQQLLVESAGGDTVPDVLHADVPPLDVPITEVPRPEACSDGVVDEA